MPPLKPFAIFLFLILTPCLLNAKAPETMSYESRKCGIRFQFPKEWLAEEIALERRAPKQRVCAIRVKPKDLARRMKDYNVDIYSVEIYVDALAYEAAMANQGFQRKGTGWVVAYGLTPPAPADEISSPEWIGAKAATSGRCHHEGGGYAGQCDIYLAVLNNRSRVSATITGQAQSEDAFNVIIKSLKFIDTAPSKEDR